MTSPGQKALTAVTEILTPNSDRWGSFTEALYYAVQANGCDAPRNKYQHAKRIMSAMGDVDIPGSIAYFEANGGYCDCEILMNVLEIFEAG